MVSFGVAPAFLNLPARVRDRRPGGVEFSATSTSWRPPSGWPASNITQAGRAKRYFIGLPSPAAGMTLATFFPFTTTELYQARVPVLAASHLMQLLMILLTILMVSNVRPTRRSRAPACAQ